MKNDRNGSGILEKNINLKTACGEAFTEYGSVS